MAKGVPIAYNVLKHAIRHYKNQIAYRSIVKPAGTFHYLRSINSFTIHEIQLKENIENLIK